MSIDKTKVFISYRHVEPDKTLARGLADYLFRHGAEAFVDMMAPPGESWHQMIGRKLSEADAVVVLLSGESVLSEMVAEEVKLAKAGGVRIVPVFVNGFRRLPNSLRAMIGAVPPVEWTERDGIEDVGAKVVAAISSDLPLPAGPSTDIGPGPIPPADGAPEFSFGAASVDSPYYVRRQADAELERVLGQQRAETILIDGPRQGGKSSLLARACALIRKRQGIAVFLDFQSLDGNQVESLPACLYAIGQHIESEVRTARKLSEYWDLERGVKVCLTQFIEREVLNRAASNEVAICFDEVDRVFAKPWAPDFFSLLRSWHNRRAFRTDWERFSLILTHSTDPYLWMPPADQSPFNVGLRLRLEDFTREQVAELASRHGLSLTVRETQVLTHLTGGQPYLVRVALHEMRKSGSSTQEIEKNALETAGPFLDHLSSLLAMLERTPAAIDALRELMDHGSCRDEIAFEWLKWSGLAVGPTKRNGRVRCELYRRFFSRHFDLAPQAALR